MKVRPKGGTKALKNTKGNVGGLVVWGGIGFSGALLLLGWRTDFWKCAILHHHPLQFTSTFPEKTVTVVPLRPPPQPHSHCRHPLTDLTAKGGTSAWPLTGGDLQVRGGVRSCRLPSRDLSSFQMSSQTAQLLC